MNLLRLFFAKYHNDILRLQAGVNIIIFIAAACGLDGEGYTAEMVCSVTLLWLALFTYANGIFERVNAAFQYENYENKEGKKI